MVFKNREWSFTTICSETQQKLQGLFASKFCTSPQFYAMCGIAFVLSTSIPPAILSKLARRGPDVQNTVNVQIAEQNCAIWLIGAVLHLRGKDGEPTTQPARDSEGNLLLWNGEVFGGLDVADGT